MALDKGFMRPRAGLVKKSQALVKPLPTLVKNAFLSRCNQGACYHDRGRKAIHNFIMIDKTLKFLTEQVNAYLQRKTGSASFGQLALSSIVNQQGGIELNDNSLGMVLVKFDEEFTARRPVNYTRRAGNKVLQANPALHLNLIVMIVAHFSNYEEALKFISLVILFFQNNFSFSKDNDSSFELPGVEELSVKLQPITWENLNQVWMAIGAKQMPSVPLRVSLVTLNEEEVTELPTVRSMGLRMEKL